VKLGLFKGGAEKLKIEIGANPPTRTHLGRNRLSIKGLLCPGISAKGNFGIGVLLRLIFPAEERPLIIRQYLRHLTRSLLVCEDLVYPCAKEKPIAQLSILIARRFGTVAPALETKIHNLSLTQLEELGEALLDFSQVADLEDWLNVYG
jgi:Domain of unknown function (DUF4351)